MSAEPRRDRLDRLDQPVEPGRVRLPRFNAETFGRWSEAIARYMGTAQFIVWMTIVIGAWFAWNTLAPEALRFDPYTFTFLTLILSLQASYAAPLILLAQNRQADRDRLASEEDRRRAAMIGGVDQSDFGVQHRQLGVDERPLGLDRGQVARRRLVEPERMRSHFCLRKLIVDQSVWTD